MVLIPPIGEYRHEGSLCSVTGGYVYRGEAVSALQGTYLYGDFCTGVVWGLRQTESGWETETLFDTTALISAFGVDENNELYMLDIGGRMFKLEPK